MFLLTRAVTTGGGSGGATDGGGSGGGVTVTGAGDGDGAGGSADGVGVVSVSIVKQEYLERLNVHWNIHAEAYSRVVWMLVTEGQHVGLQLLHVCPHPTRCLPIGC